MHVMIIHVENPKVSTAKTLRTHKPIRQTCSIQSQHIESSHVSKQKHQITLFTEGPALGGGDGTAPWASLKCKGPEASLSGHSYMGPPTSVDETLLHRNPPERQGTLPHPRPISFPSAPILLPARCPLCAEERGTAHQPTYFMRPPRPEDWPSTSVVEPVPS